MPLDRLEIDAPRRWEVIAGDALEVMRGMTEGSADAIVADPPYGLEFMGQNWDRFPIDAQLVGPAVGRDTNGSIAYRSAPNGKDRMPQAAPPRFLAFQTWCERWAYEALRALKPGGHLLAFGGCRTFHRLTCALEDSGFEVRDCIAWMFASGFPKSLDVHKAIDRAAGARGEQWRGWGTGLKPAFEPIVLARKPLQGTVSSNVQRHHTGALNIDACRIPVAGVPSGRWPANVVFTHDEACQQRGEEGWDCVPECPVRALDEQTGILNSGREHADGHRRNADKFRTAYGEFPGTEREVGVLYGDRGGASRFFYCAKASARERDAGLEAFPVRKTGKFEDDSYVWARDGRGNLRTQATVGRNPHPTVKPIDLMRWLIRLVTPPGGTVLDPFAGSGSTGCAAVLERTAFIGIEREPAYAEIARARIGWWARQPAGLSTAVVLEERAGREELGRAGQLQLL